MPEAATLLAKGGAQLNTSQKSWDFRVLGVKYFFNNEDFCTWLFEQSNYICLAHNLRAYDGIFIMN